MPNGREEDAKTGRYETAGSRAASLGRRRLRRFDLTDVVSSVSVEDDGPGIACADRERVFALGERAPNAAERQPQSSLRTRFTRARQS